MNLDITLHLSPEVERLLLAHHRELLAALHHTETIIMATLDDVMNDMTEETTAIGGLSTLIAGLKQQLADALSGASLPPAVQEKVDAVFAAAEANKASLALALGANTSQPAV